MLTNLVPHWVTQGVWNHGGIEYPLYNKAWTIKQVQNLTQSGPQDLLWTT